MSVVPSSCHWGRVFQHAVGGGVYPSMHLAGGCLHGGVSVPEVSAWGCLPQWMLGYTPSLWIDWLTDACENIAVWYSLADPRGLQRCPWGPKLFHFHAVFVKKSMQNNPTLGVGAPPPREILDPPLILTVSSKSKGWFRKSISSGYFKFMTDKEQERDKCFVTPSAP